MHRATWIALLVAGCTTEQTCGLGGACDWSLSRGSPDAGVSLSAATLEMEAGEPPPPPAQPASPPPPAARDDVAPMSPATPSVLATYVDAGAEAGIEAEGEAPVASPAPVPTPAPPTPPAPPPEFMVPDDRGGWWYWRPPMSADTAPMPDPITEGTRLAPPGYVLSDAGAGPFSQ